MPKSFTVTVETENIFIYDFSVFIWTVCCFMTFPSFRICLLRHALCIVSILKLFSVVVVVISIFLRSQLSSLCCGMRTKIKSKRNFSNMKVQRKTQANAGHLRPLRLGVHIVHNRRRKSQSNQTDVWVCAGEPCLSKWSIQKCVADTRILRS